MAQKRKPTRAMRTAAGTKAPSEKSHYHKKVIERARAARLAGFHADAPWPVTGMGER
jgi:hypothetical protein